MHIAVNATEIMQRVILVFGFIFTILFMIVFILKLKIAMHGLHVICLVPRYIWRQKFGKRFFRYPKNLGASPIVAKISSTGTPGCRF